MKQLRMKKEKKGIIYIDENDIAKRAFGNIDGKKLESATDYLIQVMSGGEFDQVAIYLSDEFKWVLGVDDGNDAILVPLNKKLPLKK